MSAAPSPGPEQSTGHGLAGRSELGVALLLGVVGVVVLVDALRPGRPDPRLRPGRPAGLPDRRRRCCCSCARPLLAVNVLRGGHGQAEEGEDVDLTAPTEWRVVLPLLGVFVANVAAHRRARLGDLRGAAVLRAAPGRWAAGTTSATLAISLAMSLVTFYGFYLGLGIHLPAGVLEGVL